MHAGVIGGQRPVAVELTEPPYGFFFCGNLQNEQIFVKKLRFCCDNGIFNLYLRITHRKSQLMRSLICMKRIILITAILIAYAISSCSTNRNVKQFLCEQGNKQLSIYVNPVVSDGLYQRIFIIFHGEPQNNGSGIYEMYNATWKQSIIGIWTCSNDTVDFFPKGEYQYKQGELIRPDKEGENLDSYYVTNKCLLTDGGLVDITDYATLWDKVFEDFDKAPEYSGVSHNNDIPDYIRIKFGH